MEQNVIRRRSKKHPKRIAMIAFAALLIAAGALCIITEVCVRRPALMLAEERTRALAAGTMSFAVMAALEEDVGQMLTVTQTDGESCLVIADTAKLNHVAALASADAQKRMSELGVEGVTIGLGEACGLTLLGGRGPRLNIRFTPVGSVTAETVSSLKSSGINQCVYSVELVLTARVQLALGGVSKVVEVKGVNTICQTVILGSVPQVYTNVANEDDMLNLIPTELP